MKLTRGSPAIEAAAICDMARILTLLWSHAGTPKDVEGVIGGVLLTLPFYKHIFAWMGAHPAGAPLSKHLMMIFPSSGLEPSACAHAMSL